MGPFSWHFWRFAWADESFSPVKIWKSPARGRSVTEKRWPSAAMADGRWRYLVGRLWWRAPIPSHLPEHLAAALSSLRGLGGEGATP